MSDNNLKRWLIYRNSINNERRRVRRKFGIRRAVLGDESGNVSLSSDPKGTVRVRYYASSDDNGDATYTTYSIVKAGTSSYLADAGRGVLVGLDIEGELAVLGADTRDYTQAGIDIRALNPSRRERQFVYLNNVVRLQSRPVGTTNTTSTRVNVQPAIFDFYNARVPYLGTELQADKPDLSSYIPTAGNHCIAIVWVSLLDKSAYVSASTAQSIDTAIDATDFAEAFASRPYEGVPVQAYLLANGQTSIDTSALYEDLRQFINTPPRVGFPHLIAYREYIRDDYSEFVGTGITIESGLIVDGALNICEDDTTPYSIDNNDITANSIQFDLNPTVTSGEGNMHWNAEDGTLNLGLSGGDVELQIGQEILVRARNTTGSLITNGSVVYINGASGQRPTIALATASTHSIADGVIGIATEDIANNGNGYVCTFGLVRDVDTNAYTAGTQLYLSTSAGQYTDTIPTPPSSRVDLGTVVTQNASEGVIFVNINGVHDIDEASDVIITSATDEDYLQWDGGASVWRNVQINTVLTKTSNYTITGSEASHQIVILGDATSGAITLTLPSASTSANLNVIVKKIDSTLNTITIDGNGSEVIDGALTQVIQYQYTSLQMVCNGTAWYII